MNTAHTLFSKQRDLLRAAQGACSLGQSLSKTQTLPPQTGTFSALPLACRHRPCSRADLPSAQHRDGQDTFSPFCRPGDRELKAAATVATLNRNILIAASQQDTASGHLQAESVITRQNKEGNTYMGAEPLRRVPTSDSCWIHPYRHIILHPHGLGLTSIKLP